ncbi:MAG TPA: 50S ribosomal protein L17 [Syntrophales bacterium]|nr:50S ribosomal protein L17 [Syntrophales bacterium]HQB29342.1 50S ribosomal protein L17 [Syntrophales bacterium]HQN77493.1 50S ribosomal protein L17 [Syntrophales bacterium]HQQ27552.1 50S ribosomal protein L17 [Syntrophales bacterium]
MRHQKAVKKLGRTSSHRKAMLRNMVTSLLKHEKIVTTDAKAKELRRVAEKMITLGKRGTLHSVRRALTVVRDKTTTKKLFDDLAKRYENRQGGYTRIVKLGYREGDNSPVSMIQLIPVEDSKEQKKKKSASGQK